MIGWIRESVAMTRCRRIADEAYRVGLARGRDVQFRKMYDLMKVNPQAFCRKYESGLAERERLKEHRPC